MGAAIFDCLDPSPHAQKKNLPPIYFLNGSSSLLERGKISEDFSWHGAPPLSEQEVIADGEDGGVHQKMA